MNANDTSLVTGATGLLGSHIAEQLVERGERVRALVRPESDTRFLESLGVELIRGDLADAESVRRAVAGTQVVYHSAAKVGDWGPWREFQRDVIDGTRHVLEACTAENVRRLIYVSSVSAYGHPKPRDTPVVETDPLGDRFWVWDYYTRAKIQAEHLVWRHHEKRGCPVVVIRPGWIYGPRDRTSIKRMARSLARRWVFIMDRGQNQLNTVYAGNVAQACLLAAEAPKAVGQAFNVSNDGGVITQREYFNAFADALGLPRPFLRVPYRVAFGFAFLLEAIGRFFRVRRPPFATRYAVWLLGRSTVYSTEKAQRDLSWQPRVSSQEGIRRTAEWYLMRQAPMTNDQ